MPLAIFKATQFTAANLVTFVVYAALAGAFFLLPIQLQTVVGFSPIASGAALLPITLIMLLGSARAGRLATRIGPRIPMSVGPIDRRRRPHPDDAHRPVEQLLDRRAARR